MAVLYVIVCADIELPSISLYQWTSLSAGIVVTALLEAYTSQIDNLVLSLALCCVFVVFL